MNTKENMSQEIQELICKLSDVKHCSVVCGDDNEIKEVHVLAGTARNIKQLVRDIQSAIHAKFGISIDYKIVSIAQINENEFKDTRLKLDTISVKNIDNIIEAVVTLTCEEKTFEGSAKRVKSKNNKLKAIAEAALAALENYLEIGQAFYLEDMQTFSVAGNELNVCVIGFSFAGKEELLSGCSIVNADENESVVKAVLSAVNRKISAIS